MSDFSTFFPSGGGGEGSGINSYAPFLVSTDDNNPQGYDATTGLYTNPVDESVWLKTGQKIRDNVTPDPYPNAFKNPFLQENVLIGPFTQTGIPASQYACPATADNRVGYKHIYYFPKRNSPETQFTQQAYKLDSGGVLIGSGMTMNLPNPNSLSGNGLYMKQMGAGFKATGNSGAGSIYVIYVDDGYGRMYVIEWSLDFSTALNIYDLGSTPGGQSSPQANVYAATYCQYADLIYFTTKANTSNGNFGSVSTWNPSTNVFSGFYRIVNSTGGTAIPISISTNPLTGQVLIGNYYTGFAAGRSTTLFNAPSAASTTINTVVPNVTIENSGTTTAAWAQLFLNPSSTVDIFGPVDQVMTATWSSGGGTRNPELLSIEGSKSFGDLTARTDASGSAQPLFIKLK